MPGSLGIRTTGAVLGESLGVVIATDYTEYWNLDDEVFCWYDVLSEKMAISFYWTFGDEFIRDLIGDKNPEIHILAKNVRAFGAWNNFVVCVGLVQRQT